MFGRLRRPEASLLGVAVLVAAVGGALIVLVFGNEPYLIELAAGFGASLLAFAVALAWEHRREQRELERELARHEHAIAAEVAAAQKKAKEEIARRLEAVHDELEVNERGLAALLEQFSQLRSGGAFVPVLPLLLDGAWKANAPGLGRILEPFLHSALVIFYGELEELRFRVRYRAEAKTEQLNQSIDELARSLARKLEMDGERRGLLKWVYDEKLSPSLDRYSPALLEDLDVSDVIRTREALMRAIAKRRGAS